MDPILLKVPLLLLAAYDAHISAKSPNPPATSEEQARYSKDNHIRDPVTSSALWRAKTFRVCSFVLLLCVYTHAICASTAHHLRCFSLRSHHHRCVCVRTNVARVPNSSPTYITEHIGSSMLHHLPYRRRTHVPRCRNSRCVLPTPRPSLHLRAFGQEGAPPRYGRAIRRSAPPCICRLHALLCRGVLRASWPRVFAGCKRSVEHGCWDGLRVHFRRLRSLHMLLPRCARVEGGSGHEAAVRSGVGSMGEAYTLQADTLHILTVSRLIVLMFVRSEHTCLLSDKLHILHCVYKCALLPHMGNHIVHHAEMGFLTSLFVIVCSVRE